MNKYAELWSVLTMDYLCRSLGVHFKGALNVSQVVVKNMIKAGIPGSIVNVSSVVSYNNCWVLSSLNANHIKVFHSYRK